MVKSVEAVGAAGLPRSTPQASVPGTGRHGPLVLSELEKRAAKIVPRPTSKVRQGGYREYQKLLTAVPAAERAKYPVAGKDLVVANAAELQLLVNGRHSALDIKKMLDAQHERRSTLQAVLNHLEILKLAGLVEW
jgi:hypothetical protein